MTDDRVRAGAPTPDKAAASELQRRLLFSMLRPAARLCSLFRLPVATLEELARLAFYQDVRSRARLSQTEAAAFAGVSLRTISRMERELGRDFFAPEREVELERRIEACFAAGVMALDEAATRLGDVPDETLRRVVDALVAVGRLTSEADGRFVIAPGYASLVRSELKARIDGLNHQLDVIVESVKNRFFMANSAAVARTLAFRMKPDDLSVAGAEVVQFLRERVGRAEDEALIDGGGVPHALTFVLAPTTEIGEEP